MPLIMDPITFNMEEILIEEVRKRPYIYDKSRAVYKNRNAREQAWKEVAQAVRLKDKAVAKKRWRSLRDSFIKIQRSLKNNPRDESNIKWHYYNQLEFLLPHIEHKEDKPIEDLFINDEDEENTQGEEDFQNFSEVFSETYSSSNSQTKTDVVCNAKKRRRNNEDPLAYTTKDVDSDEQFLLSCLPALKRLQPRENAIARMRIQQVLFQVEFGSNDEQTQILTKEEIIDS